MTSTRIKPLSPHGCAELETLLDQLTMAHESMLELARRHKQAIAEADADEIGRCAARQRELIDTIAQLESSRAALIAEALGRETTDQAPPTLSELASRVSGPARDRLMSSAARLRDLIQTIAEENKAVRHATHALLAHMEGLVRQVGAALSPAGTYGRKGRADRGAAIPSGIDISS
jgi:hypothetical protein